MKVFNLTKHSLTPDQISDGGIDVNAAQESNDTLFTRKPTHDEMKERATRLVGHAVDAGAKQGDFVLVAGAMYFVNPMIDAAKEVGLKPIASFTQRVATEKTNDDGSVSLAYTFKHEGWIEV